SGSVYSIAESFASFHNAYNPAVASPWNNNPNQTYELEYAELGGHLVSPDMALDWGIADPIIPFMTDVGTPRINYHPDDPAHQAFIDKYANCMSLVPCVLRGEIVP